MLRGTNDSCSPLRHTFYSIANPERRTCHNVLFIAPPHVTPAVNLPRYYTPTPRLLLPPLLYFLSSCRSLPGFRRVRLCLCLSISVFICLTRLIWKGCYCHECIGYQGNERKSPPSFKASLQDYTWNTHRGCIWWTILGYRHSLKWILTDVYWGNSRRVATWFKSDPASARSKKIWIKVQEGKADIGRWTSSAIYNQFLNWFCTFCRRTASSKCAELENPEVKCDKVVKNMFFSSNSWNFIIFHFLSHINLQIATFENLKLRKVLVILLDK